MKSMEQAYAIKNLLSMGYSGSKIRSCLMKIFMRKSFGGLKRLPIPMGRKVHVNRTLKDRLFRDIFSKDKQALLQESGGDCKDD